MTTSRTWLRHTQRSSSITSFGLLIAWNLSSRECTSTNFNIWKHFGNNFNLKAVENQSVRIKTSILNDLNDCNLLTISVKFVANKSGHESNIWKTFILDLNAKRLKIENMKRVHDFIQGWADHRFEDFSYFVRSVVQNLVLNFYLICLGINP